MTSWPFTFNDAQLNSSELTVHHVVEHVNFLESLCMTSWALSCNGAHLNASIRTIHRSGENVPSEKDVYNVVGAAIERVRPSDVRCKRKY